MSPFISQPDGTASTLQATWWVLHLQVAAAQEDLVYWRLDLFGCSGMVSEAVGPERRVGAASGSAAPLVDIRSYIPQAQVTPLDLAALSLALRQDALRAGVYVPRLRWEHLEGEDWSSTWKAHWQPQRVGDRLMICPAWLTPPTGENRHLLRLDPGVAFGTGAHPTTQLCLEALEMRLEDWDPQQPFRLADVGCGSGILSLAAGKFGAHPIYAVDLDPLAVEATRFNRDQNGLTDVIKVDLGSLEHIPEMVDGLVCNILADVILDLIPHFKLVVKEDGWLILSGILLDQAKIVTETLEANGWLVAVLWKRGEWCCLNVRSS